MFSMKSAFTSLAVCVALGTTQSAFAEKHVQLTKPGTSYVGSYNGQSWVVTAPNDGGQCVFINIANGGLTDSVDLEGTEEADTIIVAAGFVNSDFCGVDIEELNFNGKKLSISGRGGDDVLAGGSSNDVVMYGNDGNDTLNSSADRRPYMEGGAGDDVLLWTYSGSLKNLGGFMYGGLGNDSLCNLASVPINLIEGNEGNDNACGKATFYGGIESPTCERCYQ